MAKKKPPMPKNTNDPNMMPPKKGNLPPWLQKKPKGK